MNTETIRLAIVGLACTGLSWAVMYLIMADRVQHWRNRYHEERRRFESARILYDRTLDNSIKITKGNQRLRRCNAQLLSHRGLRGAGR